MKRNEKIAKILKHMGELYEINGVKGKPFAYRRAAKKILELKEDIKKIYKEKGTLGLENLPGIGKRIARRIEEFLKTGKIKDYEKLKEKTKIREIVTHYFKTKGLSLEKLKESAKKRKIIYSRYTKPAKQLLELAGSVEKAKKAISKVAEWAKSRNLDYAIETVFKKWLELDKLKPKEIVKKPYFKGMPMVWSETKKKWYVISPEGEWLEFAGKESEIEWRIEK
jgi:DNA polymerase/3'-5' exonuclease PolX